MPAAVQATTLTDFGKYLADFKSTSALVGKLALAVPLADLALNIGTPWPNRPAITVFIMVVQLVVLMYGYLSWIGAATSDNAVRATFRRGIVLLGISTVGYLLLFSAFIVTLNGVFHREVIGYTLTPMAQIFASQQPLLAAPADLLKQFESTPEKVWTTQSLAVTRVSLLCAWLLWWISFSVVVASFVAICKRKDLRHKA
jgi:hypothetical protein